MSKSRRHTPRDENARALTQRGGGGFHKSKRRSLEEEIELDRVRRINKGDLSAIQEGEDSEADDDTYGWFWEDD